LAIRVRDTQCVVEEDRACVVRFPEPDGLGLCEFRGFDIARGFGYKETGSGEGLW